MSRSGSTWRGSASAEIGVESAVIKPVVAGVVVAVAAVTGAVGSARAAVRLTVHPGQTIHVARLHLGDSFVCRTPTHALRWNVTVANVTVANLHDSGSFAWD